MEKSLILFINVYCGDVVQTLEADLKLARGQLTQYVNENAELKSTVQILTANVRSLEVCVLRYIYCSLFHASRSNLVEMKSKLKIM